MARFCSSCGAALTEGAAFCNSCGARVDAQATPPVQVVYMNPKIPGRGFGITSMVLGIIGLIYSFSVMMIVKSLKDFRESWVDPDFKSSSVESAMMAILMVSSLSILAAIFGYQSRKRGFRNGISKSGLVMGVIGIFIYAIGLLALATI